MSRMRVVAFSVASITSLCLTGAAGSVILGSLADMKVPVPGGLDFMHALPSITDMAKPKLVTVDAPKTDVQLASFTERAPEPAFNLNFNINVTVSDDVARVPHILSGDLHVRNYYVEGAVTPVRTKVVAIAVTTNVPTEVSNKYVPEKFLEVLGVDLSAGVKTTVTTNIDAVRGEFTIRIEDPAIGTHEFGVTRHVAA
jgi:hypothetical protein